jgi:hypothetical protein
MNMRKQIVKWKPVSRKNIYGEEYVTAGYVELIVEAYRGTLIDEILSMPKKSGISFAVAVNMTCDAFHQACNNRKSGQEPGHGAWFHRNFVRYISEKGFHIELTGDEFEVLTLSSRVC